MKKNKILFPGDTSRQASQNKSLHNKNSIEIKNKDSFSLLKLINEDIKRIKHSNSKKLPILEKLHENKQIKNQMMTSKRIKQLSVPKKLQGISGLKIQKKNPIKHQTHRTIVPQIISYTVATTRKATVRPIDKKRSTINVKLSSQKVIVAQNKRQISKIDEDLIYQRRENYLNSKFNDRISRLNTITKQNKRIYDRINSQRSHYSNNDLNKSYESSSSISKRLSNSKISNRSRLSMSSQRQISNSRCSIDSKRSVRFRKQSCIQSKQILKGKINNPKKIIKIQSKNINQLKIDQIQNFSNLFDNRHLDKNKIKSKIMNKARNNILSKENNQQISMQLTNKNSIKIQNNNNKLPNLKRSYKTVQQNQNQRISNKQKISSVRNRILSTIDQNIIGSNLNSINYLHKIVQEHLISRKNILNSSLKR